MITSKSRSKAVDRSQTCLDLSNKARTKALRRSIRTFIAQAKEAIALSKIRALMMVQIKSGTKAKIGRSRLQKDTATKAIT